MEIVEELTLYGESNENILINTAIKLIELLQENNIQVVIYGSLGCMLYSVDTADTDKGIGDVDLLVSEESFPSIIKILKSQQNMSFLETGENSINVIDGEHKIKLDSIEFYLEDINKQTREVIINRCTVEVLTLEPLIAVYEKAAQMNPLKSGSYLEKIELLLE